MKEIIKTLINYLQQMIDKEYYELEHVTDEYKEMLLKAILDLHAKLPAYGGYGLLMQFEYLIKQELEKLK